MTHLSQKLLDKSIADIKLLGSDEKILWSQAEDALTITPPQNKPSDHAIVFKITLKI